MPIDSNLFFIFVLISADTVLPFVDLCNAQGKGSSILYKQIDTLEVKVHVKTTGWASCSEHSFDAIYLTPNLLLLGNQDFLRIIKKREVAYDPRNYLVTFGPFGHLLHNADVVFIRQHPNITTQSTSRTGTKFALLVIRTRSQLHQPHLLICSQNVTKEIIIPEVNEDGGRVYVVGKANRTVNPYEWIELENGSRQECEKNMSAGLTKNEENKENAVLNPMGSGRCIKVQNSSSAFSKIIPKQPGVFKKIEEKFCLFGLFRQTNVLYNNPDVYVRMYNELGREEYDWIRKNERCSSAKQFTCTNGKCVDIFSVCNGETECEDSSDEDPFYCSSLCPEGEVPCGIGVCINAADHALKCVEKTKIAGPIAIIVSDWFKTSTSIGLVILALGVITMYYIQVKRLKKKIRSLTQKEVESFLKGAQPDDSNEPSDYARRIPNGVQAMPWDRQMEIPRKLIQIECEITRGHFGIISKGRLLQQNARDFRCDVAIKRPIPSIRTTEFKALLDEIKIMSYIGSHESVVRFFGGCTDNIRKRDVLLVMEYCTNGCLLNYLRINKQSFCCLVTDAINIGDSGYINVTERDTSFNTNTLFKWAMQTALGLKFLASIKILHRDIAARNLLLSDKLRVKIADFGLSKKLEHGSETYAATSGDIPWKWMAPETLKIPPSYSVKSDIWAFGVTLWEMFSLGEIPYIGSPWGSTFCEEISEGLRLQKPKHATDEIYKLMEHCWIFDPDNRPTFTEANECILSMLKVFEDDGVEIPLSSSPEYFEVAN